MSIFSEDTSPEAEKILIDLLRKTPGWRKLELVGEINETVKLMNLSGLKARYPDDSPEKLRRRLADLLLGKELAEKAYGPFIDEEDSGEENHAS